MTPVPTRRIPEKVVQQQIVTLLRSIGAVVYVLGTRRRREDHQGTMQTPGIPDLWAFLPRPAVVVGVSHPVGLWIECKADGGRLSPDQVRFCEECERTGTPWVGGGVEQVIAFLVRGGWLKPANLPHYRVEALHEKTP